MKYILVLSIYAIIYLPCLGGNYIEYYKKVNEAKYRLYTKDIESAKKLYREAFAMVEKPLGKDLYLMARCFAFENKLDSASYYLTKASLYPFVFFKPDVLHDTTWTALFKFYPDLKKTIIINDSLYMDNIESNESSLKAYKYMEECLKKDQTLRNYMSYVREAHDTSDAIYKDAVKIAIETDDKIQKELNKYIFKKGFPGMKKCHSDLVGAILIHYLPENYNDLKPFLMEGLKKGEIFPFEVLQMMDRVEFSNDDKCGYYFYNTRSCKECDWANIIKRRLEIGVSIYFNEYGRGIFETYEVAPWVGTLIK